MSPENIKQLDEETETNANSNELSSQEEISKMMEQMENENNDNEIQQSHPPSSPFENVQKKEFPPVSNEVHSKTPLDLEFILDIPLQVSVEIGRTKMLINDLLQLGQGSVIELEKLVGEPFEVLVNDKLVARGEVVVVNERFGVRLTDIISPMERVQQLA